MDGLIIGLAVAVAVLIVAAIMAGLAVLRFTKIVGALAWRVGELENSALGLHYDTGLHAIALDDAGLPIHNDTRELAEFARRHQPEDTPPNAVFQRSGDDWNGLLDAERNRAALAGDQVALAGDQVALAGDQVALAGDQVALAGDQVALAGDLRRAIRRVAEEGSGPVDADG